MHWSDIEPDIELSKKRSLQEEIRHLCTLVRERGIGALTSQEIENVTEAAKQVNLTPPSMPANIESYCEWVLQTVDEHLGQQKKQKLLEKEEQGENAEKVLLQVTVEPIIEPEELTDADYAIQHVRAAGGVDYTTFTDEQKVEMIAKLNKQHAGNLEVVRGKYGYTVKTLRPYKDNEVIATYWGTEIDEDIAEQLPKYYDKVVPSVRRGFSLVGDVLPKGQPLLSIATLINDPGFEGEKKVKGNVQLRKVDGKVKMVAKVPIPAGTELGFRYGHGYWIDIPGYYPTEKLREEAERKWILDNE